MGAFGGVLEQPAGVRQGHAHTAVAAGHAEGLASVLLPRRRVHADGLVGRDAHGVRNAGHRVGAAAHGDRAVLREHLRLEDRRRGRGFAGAYRDHPHHIVVAVVSGELLVGEVDDQAGDKIEHGTEQHFTRTSCLIWVLLVSFRKVFVSAGL